ncbi:MAG: ABC transporter permease [Nanoarchaeota archaeon]|nr:ABC transporter permease [Nanoarchaeota archaeon]
MKLQKSFKLALNILLHSKLRSWLTIIGIVIGVASVVAIVSIGEGAKENVQERLSGLGADLITVSPGSDRASGGFRGGFGGFRDHSGGGRGSFGASSFTLTPQNLTKKDIQVIKPIEGIKLINGIVSGRAELFYLAETSDVSVDGVDPLVWKQITTAELEVGRFLNPSDTNVIVIGSRIAESTFKQPLALNRAVTIEGRLFKVVGILKESGRDDNKIFMPIDTARDILEDVGREKFDSIIIKAENPDLVEQITAQIDAKLMISRRLTERTKDFRVSSSQAIQERVQDITQTFTVFLAAIAAVSLLVGAVGIANTMFTSVLEKTKEIGIMKAIGARNFDIMMVFLINSGLVGLVGGILGISLGSAISLFLPNVLSGFGPGGQLRTVIPVSLLISALLISIIIGMIAGAIPAYRASKLKPVDALRYE